MDTSALIELTHRMLIIVLLVSLPVVAVSVIVGLVVGMLQAVTQIQDQSIAYGAKLVAAIVTIALAAGWGGGELHRFALRVFENLQQMR